MCRFFFQAEDGIRDYKVTGVQTCALPIWSRITCHLSDTDGAQTEAYGPGANRYGGAVRLRFEKSNTSARLFAVASRSANGSRSEERRVGKEWRGRWLEDE